MEVIAGIHIFYCGLPALDFPQTSTVHSSLLLLFQSGFPGVDTQQYRHTQSTAVIRMR